MDPERVYATAVTTITVADIYALPVAACEFFICIRKMAPLLVIT